MWRTSAHTQIGSYAVHQVRVGGRSLRHLTIPLMSAYWRVGVIRQHGWRWVGRDLDG
jgi:hypothetical protein